MAKTTIAQARKSYETFHGVLWNFNGGTREENVRMADRCLTDLEAAAAVCAQLAAAPSKYLVGHPLFEQISQDIPARLARYRRDYFPG